MSEILTKIKKKINFQYGLNQKIEEINFILSQKKALLVDEEVEELKEAFARIKIQDCKKFN